MTLSNAKAAYKAAKTQKGKQSAFNKAMLNLSESDKHIFVAWQVELMNKNN